MKHIVTKVPASSNTVFGMIRALKNRYPFINIAPIGHSTLGRPINGICIGQGRKKVLYAGAFHGQEWLTSLMLLRFCEEICHALRYNLKLSGIHIKTALLNSSLIIVPQVNPDGVDIAVHGSGSAGIYGSGVRKLGGNTAGLWQANARGVDINHNFDAGWDILNEQETAHGITGPAPRQWGGIAPESEDETIALVKLCRRVNFRHVVALHSQGEEIYWDYGEKTPAKGHVMAEMMGTLSGYEVAKPDGLASHGGFKDWFIKEFGKPGFTIEMGKGINPLPLSDFDSIYKKLFEMFILLAIY